MKRFSCLLISLTMLISFSSCKKNDNIPEEQTTIELVTEILSDKSEISNQYIPTETTILQSIETTAVSEETTAKQWTTAVIVDTYKKAATATHSSAILQQEISLTDISINNGEGGINSVLKLVKPIISSVVSGNSTEITGITGGYTQLTESDLVKAEAYTKATKTIIKLIPKDQTDAMLVNEHHGTVGHLISVVGDNISTVLGQMSDSGLPIEITKENISAVYVSPSVNVTINEDGIIENGTWRYTVTLTLSNFKVSGSTVNNASVTMDNIITLNGGFSE